MSFIAIGRPASSFASLRLCVIRFPSSCRGRRQRRSFTPRRKDAKTQRAVFNGHAPGFQFAIFILQFEILPPTRPPLTPPYEGGEITASLWRARHPLRRGGVTASL